MLPPQDVSIFLNNALRATKVRAMLDGETPLPDEVRNMPDQVTGTFVQLEDTAVSEIQTAWKRVMILNPTEVLYTFSFDPDRRAFLARKR